MNTRVITLRRVDVTSVTTSVSTMRFLAEIMLILWAIKFTFKGSYDKQNLTLMVISYEMTTRVRSSVYMIGKALSGELFCTLTGLGVSSA